MVHVPLLDKVKAAKRESKSVEFKERFDVQSLHDWVEIVKDIVAMANSGGGVIAFGVRNNGTLAEFDPTAILKLDPAVITDKVEKYTGEQFSDFSIEEVSRNDHRLAVFLISAVSIPIVFNKEGSYEDDRGEQRLAFRKGTAYFRHGAKSEPATTNDLRVSIERELARIRASWLGGIRKVVEAPKGSQIQVVSPGAIRVAAEVRLTESPAAIPVERLMPDQTHPYRQKEVLALVNKRLGGAAKVNSFDVLCARKVHGVESKPLYFYESKFGSPQYSDAFIEWLVSQYQKDAAFFETCRAKSKAK